jgi:hypothetical protein
MGAKQSAEMKKAIRLHRVKGRPVYAAAKAAGVDPSALYKALKKALDKRMA